MPHRRTRARRIGRSARARGDLLGAAARGYTARPRACGGIGRRARLRALWTAWSVEVRVLSGALRKPRTAGFFLASRSTTCRGGWLVRVSVTGYPVLGMGAVVEYLELAGGTP